MGLWRCQQQSPSVCMSAQQGMLFFSHHCIPPIVRDVCRCAWRLRPNCSRSEKRCSSSRTACRPGAQRRTAGSRRASLSRVGLRQVHGSLAGGAFAVAVAVVGCFVVAAAAVSVSTKKELWASVEHLMPRTDGPGYREFVQRMTVPGGTM